MPVTPIIFSHSPSELISKDKNGNKTVTVIGRINRNIYSSLQVGDEVTWDGYKFFVSDIKSVFNVNGRMVCDLWLMATISQDSPYSPCNMEAKKKLIEKQKAEKAEKLALLKEKARERRRLRKEQEQKIINEAQSKLQSTIGSLEL